MPYEGQHPTETTFPSHCQPSNVTPPDEAQVFIRFITAVPLDHDDFKTHAELGRVSPGDALYCQGCTLSLFAPMEKAIEKLRRRVRGQRESRTIQATMLSDLVAVANGKSLSGVVEKGKKSHYSWWIAEGTDRVSPFMIVDVDSHTSGAHP